MPQGSSKFESIRFRMKVLNAGIGIQAFQHVEVKAVPWNVRWLEPYEIEVVSLNLFPVIAASSLNICDVDIHPVMPSGIHCYAPDVCAVTVIYTDHGEAFGWRIA